MSYSVVVLSDLHANATALRAALEKVDALAPDRVIVLGDLLTYGVDIAETLELVEGLAARGAPVLLGNHDKLYLDLASGDRTYFDGLPDWLRESAEHTLHALDASWFERTFSFVDEHIEQGWLFAHANPFGVPDWTYLNHAPELIRAASAIRDRGLVAGVFGHTHRRRIHRVAGGVLERLGDSADCVRNEGAIYLINTGSVGQPRGDDGLPSILHIEFADDSTRASLVPFEFDTSRHLARIDSMAMSEATKFALRRFFAPPSG